MDERRAGAGLSAVNKPELILHAGLHKTGTTEIQQYAYANRRALRALGLFYPDFWPYQLAREKGHHQFAHAVATKSERLGLVDVGKLADRWLDVARRENTTVLFSAEPVCRHVLRDGPGAGSSRGVDIC